MRGAKLRQPQTPVQGELTLHKWRDGSNRGSIRLRADLMGPDREPALDCLIDSMVVKISAGGIVIMGTELVPRTRTSSKSNVDDFPQTWWCRFLPGAMEYLPPKPPELPALRKAFLHHGRK